MLRFLSSLRFMMVLVISLVVTLLMGILLGRLESWRMVMRSPFADISLNRVLFIDWMQQRFWDHPTVGIWLLVAGILGALLLINMLLCTGTGLWRRWKSRQNPEYALLLLIHLFFAISLLCHGLALIWGQKTTARLSQDESMVLPDGRVLTVETLSFTSDPFLLNRSRHDRTSDVYDWNNNFVILRAGDEILSPVRHLYPAFDSAGYQYSLPMFMDAARSLGKRKHHDDQGASQGAGVQGFQKGDRSAAKAPQPAALIVATRRHVDLVFLVSFGLVLMTVASYLILTRNKRTSP